MESPYPVSLEDGIQAGESLELAVIGYRHNQPGVVGEVFPSRDYGADEFLHQFREDYGVEPAVTALIVAVGSDEDRTRRVDEKLRWEAELATELSGVPGIEAEPVEVDLVREEWSRTQRTPSPPYDIVAPWAPGAATSVQSYEDDGAAVIETSQAWVPFEGHDENALRYDFGIEIEVNQFNALVRPEVPGATRPSCVWSSSPAADYQDGFWASHEGSGNSGIYSWAVRTETGDPIAHGPIGAYWDWADVLDECSRQAMTIGIAHPQEIPPNAAGIVAVETEIRAPRGEVDSSSFSAGYDTVYNDCEYIRIHGVSVPNPVPSTPSSWCMAISSNLDYPGSVGSQLVVNRNRGYALPTCTFTYQDDGYLDEPYVEERACP